MVAMQKLQEKGTFLIHDQVKIKSHRFWFFSHRRKNKGFYTGLNVAVCDVVLAPAHKPHLNRSTKLKKKQKTNLKMICNFYLLTN